MDTEYVELINSLLQKHRYYCPVCGSKRYVTNFHDLEITIHCSSIEAKFWNFGSATLAHTVAKQHWDQSKLEFCLSLEDILEWIRRDEPFSEQDRPADQDG
jgi:hypothetical protein